MATINYYLDKADKKGYSPIHLRIICNRKQIKIATGEKVKCEDFDKENQLLAPSCEQSIKVNHYLKYLKDRADELLNNSYKKSYTNNEIKSKLNEFIDAYKTQNQANIKEQVPLYGKSFTFIDLFAGAGGFSEGFLQAEHNNKWFDFLLANDINENCDLTHRVRYNYQLGLDAEFLCQDVTEPDFLDNLLQKLDGKTVDVVCGGPPCQSFSLAGKRKKFDKKDDLFSHYLEVIKKLQPKYFVMENVKGILTKEKGLIKERILDEIRSIVDINELPALESFIKRLKATNPQGQFLLDSLVSRVDFERHSEKELDDAQANFIKKVESKFRSMTPKIADYKTSKTDIRVSTIRHGFNLLVRSKQLRKLQKEVIKEKDYCNVDNDYFVDSFTDFLSQLDVQSIIKKIESAFNDLKVPQEYEQDCHDILSALHIYSSPFEACIEYINRFCTEGQQLELTQLLEGIRLYKIDAPFVANASNYGVPQNRERVLFIGCRKDQDLITEIPATVSVKEKVTVFEALHDLDFIGNDEEARQYQKTDISKQYNSSAKKMKALIRERSVEGRNGKMAEQTYADWSRNGRLSSRFDVAPPFYVKNHEELHAGLTQPNILHNHKTSKQNEDVINRLQIILNAGGYGAAQEKLNECGLSSQKRNYNVLKPEGQSPTVMTIPDDYVHYNSPRALTVREMARLQSFDDSFVFQGKRSTGGNKRKSEVPQFTLVGNAVPPLMARAVAMEILKNIK
ncbi:DNA cytosine methyltransferase [Roseivirga pacifica]|uniref:DNA cytosine methyltransferase n=1 Tax=Roseivirga pacifica TaxID=1267423 RepID=UPI003BAF9498